VVDGSLLAIKLAMMAAAPTGRRPYVVVCPDAGAAYKEWPPERWGAVIEHLSCRCDVLVCGMPGRPPIPAPAAATRLDVDVASLATLAAGAQLLIGPDSGHLHLADALGTRVVGLYGATSSVTYGPYRDRAWCIDTHAEHAPANGRYNSARHWSGSQMCSIPVDRVVDMLDQVSGECRAGDAPHCQPGAASPQRFAAEPPDGY
jgi:ADP-heptose:LPS heptosyltransferase